MSSWKARIGYLSPSVFEMPSDWNLILPPGFTLVTSGLNVRAHTAEEFNKAIGALESALSVFVAEEVDAVLLGGITLGTQRGYKAERDTIASVSQKLGLPVNSGLHTSVEALRHLGAQKIVIATAYKETINRAVKRYFEDGGLEVLGIAGLNVSKPVEQVKLPHDAPAKVARELLQRHPDADAVLIHGRWHCLSVVETLEIESKRPVVATTAASLWWVLRTLKMATAIEGYGGLLRK